MNRKEDYRLGFICLCEAVKVTPAPSQTNRNLNNDAVLLKQAEHRHRPVN